MMNSPADSIGSLMMRQGLAIALGILLCACSVRDGYFKATAGNELFPRSTWKLVKIGGPQAGAPVKKTTLWIDGPEQISGTSGCNRYAGRFSVESPGKVTVRVYGLTKDECKDDVMTDEQKYLLNLASTVEYQVISDELYLINIQGDTMLVFRRD